MKVQDQSCSERTLRERQSSSGFNCKRLSEEHVCPLFSSKDSLVLLLKSGFLTLKGWPVPVRTNKNNINNIFSSTVKIPALNIWFTSVYFLHSVFIKNCKLSFKLEVWIMHKKYKVLCWMFIFRSKDTFSLHSLQACLWLLRAKTKWPWITFSYVYRKPVHTPDMMSL